MSTSFPCPQLISGSNIQKALNNTRRLIYNTQQPVFLPPSPRRFSSPLCHTAEHRRYSSARSSPVPKRFLRHSVGSGTLSLFLSSACSYKLLLGVHLWPRQCHCRSTSRPFQTASPPIIPICTNKAAKRTQNFPGAGQETG